MLGYGQNSNNGYIFMKSIITRDIYSHFLLYFSLYLLNSYHACVFAFVCLFFNLFCYSQETILFLPWDKIFYISGIALLSILSGMSGYY